MDEVFCDIQNNRGRGRSYQPKPNHLVTIRRFLSYQHFEMLIHAFVTSRLDNCSSLLSGLPQNLLQKLQYVQNSAARLLSFTRKTEHITTILKELHRLLVAVRIEFKILVLVFKAYHGIAPLYISDSSVRVISLSLRTKRQLQRNSLKPSDLPVRTSGKYKSYGCRTNGHWIWYLKPKCEEVNQLESFMRKV